MIHDLDEALDAARHVALMDGVDGLSSEVRDPRQALNEVKRLHLTEIHVMWKARPVFLISTRPSGETAQEDHPAEGIMPSIVFICRAGIEHGRRIMEQRV